MSKFKSKKKSHTTYSEIALIVIAIVAVGFSLFFSSYKLNESKHNLNKAPQINYEFPNIFINTFLNIKINDEDKKELKLDKDKDYYIKDLIYINSEKSKKIIEKYRVSYIQDSLQSTNIKNPENMHDLFMKFSKKNYDTSTDNLLHIKYVQKLNEISSLSNYIKSINYYYYIKTSNNKYAIIEFYKNQ